MKKNVLKMINYILAVCLVVCTISCTKDDPTADPTTDPTEEMTADITYKVAKLHDLHLLTDITATYTGADGKAVTETITQTPWEKKIVKVAVPFEAKLKIVYKRKADVKYTQESYRAGGGMTIIYKTATGGNDGSMNESEITLPKVSIEKYLIKLETNEHIKEQLISK